MNEHTHSYVRIRGKTDLFMCKDPDCSYYCKKELLEGKKAACGICGQKFILSREQLRRKLPRCSDCKRVVSKKTEADNSMDELLKGMLG